MLINIMDCGYVGHGIFFLHELLNKHLEERKSREEAKMIPGGRTQQDMEEEERHAG